MKYQYRYEYIPYNVYENNIMDIIQKYAKKGRRLVSVADNHLFFERKVKVLNRIEARCKLIKYTQEWREFSIPLIKDLYHIEQIKYMFVIEMEKKYNKDFKEIINLLTPITTLD